MGKRDTLRKTFYVNLQAFEFLEFVAETRKIGLSGAFNMIFLLLARGDLQALKGLIEDFSKRRQY